MEQATSGDRLRTLRRWRGMSQAQVAHLAGLPPSFVSAVEHGARCLDRRSQIAALASALSVSDADLVGGPRLTADRLQSDPHMVIPDLREALLYQGPLPDQTPGAQSAEELARHLADELVPLVRDADYTSSGTPLAQMISQLRWHAARPAGQATRRLTLEALLEACVAAGLIARNLGYLDLAHVAALRAAEAAGPLDDPVQRGKAECLRLWAFPRERAWDRRLAAAQSAAAQLRGHAATPLGLQVLGMLALHAALAAAVTGQPDTAGHWLAEAGRIAARIDDDGRGNWQSFGATNVAIWTGAIGVELGDTGGVALSKARDVDQSKIAYRDRRAAFLADTGRALAREPATRADAARWLRRAEDAAPQLIRNSPAVREAVAFLLNRARAEAGVPELREMALRMGIAM